MFWIYPGLFPTVQQVSPNNNGYQNYGGPVPGQQQNFVGPAQNYGVPSSNRGYGRGTEEDDEEDPYANYHAYPPQYPQPNYYPGGQESRAPRYSRGAVDQHTSTGGQGERRED